LAVLLAWIWVKLTVVTFMHCDLGYFDDET